MADEEKTTPQEEKPVADKPVTDADLSSAWEKEQTETKTEVTEEKQEVKEELKEKTKDEVKEEHKEDADLPEEPTDNAERSRLGRRLKQMEDFNKQLQESQKQLLEEIRSLKGGKETPVPTANHDNMTYNDDYVRSQVQAQMEAAITRGEIPETIVTPYDSLVVENFIRRAESQVVKDAEQKFINGYVRALESPKIKGDTPDDLHAEVIAELCKDGSPFAQKRFGHPMADAHMNYLEAKAAILAKKTSELKPQSKFKGKPEDAPPTGTSVSTKVETTAKETPQLDASCMAFIKSQGMSPESVKNALEKDMPFHLKGRY